MPTPADACLVRLDAVERGFVLGVLLLATAEDGDLTEALLPPSRERCAAALAAIAALPRTDRVRVTGAMAREAMAAFPARIEGVHPDQLAAVLSEESPATLALIARGAPPVVRAAAAKAAGIDRSAAAESPGDVDPAWVADLQRAALAPIAALPPRGDGLPERRTLALLDRPAAALQAETASLGAPGLGRLLSDAEGEGLGTADLLLAVAQRLAPSLGRALLEAADARRRERRAAPAGSPPTTDEPPHRTPHHRR